MVTNVTIAYEGAHECASLDERLPLDRANAAEIESACCARSRYLALRRVVEIAIALVAAPAVGCVIALAALAIVMSMGRPVFFLQERVGFRGRVFKIVKLRTMTSGSVSAAPSATSISDKRVTPLGSILRLSHIDELPQLWNILSGDMSFIGPRPEQTRLVDEYKGCIPHFDLRHCVRPGLSGWAQVRFGYASDTKETRTKLEYDLYYIRNAGLKMDFKILWLTFTVYLNPRYAR
jgi:lipopolysaccharide/colanic/teichoic acid biosynthesis glycosyltransferase